MTARSKKTTATATTAEIILKTDEKVVFAEQDSKFQKLSVDQILENTLITGKDSSNSVLGALIQEAMDDVKMDIKKNIRSVMLKAIGFEVDRWGEGRLDVDHCNGRMSEVSNCISQYTGQFVRNTIEEYIRSHEDSIISTVQKAIAQEIKTEISRTSHYNSVRSKLTEMAQTIISSEVDSLTKEKLMIQQAVEKSLESSLLAKATPAEIKEAREIAKNVKRSRR